jgi:hypothetical protein
MNMSTGPVTVQSRQMWFGDANRLATLRNQTGAKRKRRTPMRRVQIALMSVLTVAIAAPVAVAQTSSAPWTHLRTPWGDPDLQGIWPSTSMLQTPFERDPKLGTRAVLTDEEYAQRLARARAFFETRESPRSTTKEVEIGSGWLEYGRPNRQASLVVDPPDGRIPALTSDAQKREAARLARYEQKRDAPDSYEDLTTWDRCITLGAVGSMLPFFYNNGIEIVQAPHYVVIRNEMVHEARIVPLDGRPHAGSMVRMWMGDSRGHWEGNTLIVETTNFNARVGVGPGDGGFNFGAATRPTPNLHVVERFTRVDEHTINYEVTIHDSKTWTKPWKIAYPLKNEPNYTVISEYACHEGNIFMYDVLSGARAQERETAQSGANGSK